ncbi:MAG: hypothetical protein A2Y63_03760 [Candidatus Riflebacteria bacterium RBG_13_59_9]|nr:MAG: hypothetical protein A2Y63_03760 [Candidatus Riflebacteria bacterium RBG_13_59_9]
MLATGQSEHPALADRLGSESAGRAHVMKLNYPDDRISAVAAKMEELMGSPLDILLHCLGPTLAKPIDETETDELVSLLQTNAVSFQEALVSFVPLLASGTGRIVVFTVAGSDNLVSRQMLPAYFAAKSALVSLLKSWALRLAPRGITVNGLAPGLFAGELRLDASARRRHSGFGASATKVPAGREGEWRDLEHVLGFLLSPESSYVTGNNILVSGGYAV